jgi:uncharacterized protein YjbI with pentapeptide repeats
MANPEHLAVVKQDNGAISRWRNENPATRLDLTGADLSEVNLSGADLRGANLTGADLSGADIIGANLSGANLSDANLGWASLSNADLIGANLRGADLIGAALSEANLGGADLTGANLSEASLRGADLTGAKLVGANLSGANLSDANLGWASLSNADLIEADLSYADLSGADLRGADLTGASLGNAKLRYAKLSGANLSKARCESTLLGNVDLSETRGLETITHYGPSEISVSALYSSGGKIPKVFLRGCGVPDNLITHLPSLINSMSAIQFYSCFISYSSKNEEFCKRLHSRLEQDHVSVWFAPEDMKGGQKIHEQLDAAIRLHDKLLLVVSEHSMNSEWVRTEIREARKREVKEGKRVLFPIRLVPFEGLKEWKAPDSDTGKDMAVEVREYYVPDFTNWKDHDSFEAEYKKLLRDLQASAEKPK